MGSTAANESFIDKVKKAGKSLVDSGAKTMLKTDIVFLEREVKSRKQRFGVEIYELMEALEIDSELSIDEKEARIRMSFDRARKDIAVIQAKIDCKNEEMATIDAELSGAPSASVTTGAVPPSSGHIITNEHPDDAAKSAASASSSSEKTEEASAEK